MHFFCSVVLLLLIEQCLSVNPPLLASTIIANSVVPTQVISATAKPISTVSLLDPSPEITTPEVTPVIDLKCPFNIDPQWGIAWLPTSVGQLNIQKCPYGFYGNAYRFCKFNQFWGMPMVKDCVGNNVQGFKSGAQSFFNGQSANVEGAKFLLNQLANLTKPPVHNNRIAFLSKSDLSTVNFVTGQSLDVLFQQGGGGDQIEDVVDLLNNALDVRNKDSWLELQESETGSEELLNNAETYAHYLGAIRANLLSNDEQIESSVFPLESDLINSSAAANHSSIKIPSALLQTLAQDYSNITVVSMLFSTLQEFLPTNNSLESDILASVIISSQVMTNSGNIDASNVLQDNPIELVFSINETYSLSNTSLEFRCVYWNFTDDFNSTSFGGWATDGITAERIDNSTVKCISSHLTSFSVLVDVVSDNINETESVDPGIQEQLLSVVSYIGCSISIVCLIVTIIWLLTMGKALFTTEVYNFIHLCLAISLLLALIVFVAGVQYASSVGPLCKAVAAVLHYLFLSAFCWMLCEAIMLFLLLVIVFSKLSKKWWLYCLIGWGLPVIPVAITLGIDFHNYTPDTGICWLNNSNHLIWGFVGPMIAIIVVNASILVIVLVKIFQSKNNKIKSTKTTHGANRDTAVDLIKGAVILLPLLGVTWIIGVFAIDANTTVFAWLFTVLNSLQGAFIFFFHVLRSKKFTRKIKSIYFKWKKQKQAQSQLSYRTSYSITNTSTF